MLDTEQAELSGKAISFNTQSNYLGFYETISPEAISQDLINRSDVILCVNHSEDAILGRSVGGEGTLKLERRDDGVYFTCSLPKTTLGYDTYQQVQRRDLRSCSFAFTIPNEKGAQEWSKKDGVMYRKVNKIDKLYDISIVCRPAYEDTTVMARSMQEYESAKAEIEEAEQREAEQTHIVEEPIAEEVTDNTETVETVETPIEQPQSVEEQEVVETPTEEPKVEGEPIQEQTEAREETNSQITDENQPINIVQKRNITKMNKNFSLLRAIRNASAHREMDAFDAAVMESAREEMRKAGISYEGQIQMPLETRALTVKDEGEDVVETDVTGILMPLRENSVLFNMGIHELTGLVGDVQIPKMSGATAVWESEVGDALQNSGITAASFGSIKMSPKRLVTYVDISNQLLKQDSIGVENAIRADIVNAIRNKIEATVFGNGALSETTPKGILNGKVATSLTDFESLCEFEASVADANYNGNMVYVLSPKAKAALRSAIKGTNGTGMVYESGEVDGTKAYTTSFLKDKNVLYVDPSCIYFGSWGGLDLTIDNITLAAQGKTRLVLNMYVDVAYVRDEAIAVGAFA